MAISFNDYIEPEVVCTYDGGVLGSNNAGSSTFDYFPDDAEVGDAIYFGLGIDSQNSEKWFRNIKLYVGTAFAASSVTFAWEYSKGIYNFSTDNANWSELTVTNGDALLSTGEQVVSFTPNPFWEQVRKSNPYLDSGAEHASWIRCRITAIDTPTEGGAQSTQNVEIGNNTITVTGYTEESPCTFQDVYEADVDGSWGVVEHQFEHAYQFDMVSLWVGSLSTAGHFGDDSKFVAWINAHAVAGNFLRVNDGSTLQLGTLDTNGMGIQGCTIEVGQMVNSTYAANIYLSVKTGGTFNLYGSRIYQKDHSRDIFTYGTYYINCETGSTIDIRDTTIEDTTYNYFETENLSLQRVKFYHVSYGIRSSITMSSYLENIVISDITHSFLFFTGGATMKVKGLVTDDTENKTFALWCYSGGGTLYLLNPMRTDYNNYWTADGTVYYEFEFDFKVQDRNGDGISGATVAIIDTDGVAITDSPFTTDANGEITTQNIKYKTLTKNTISTSNIAVHSPHTVTISKSGYKTKRVKYDMDRKREEVETLEPDDPATTFTAMEVAPDIYQQL